MEFKVFTLNCWGLAFVSKNRKPRIQAIAEVLATSSYDVVCLQEVWTQADFNLIKDKSSGVLPYSHYFYSGITGSGVCILSRHPIVDAFFHQWSINGYMHKLHHGDWFGGKGVGMCKFKVNNYTINVYSAHLHAEYDRNSDEYLAHRVLQAYDTAQFIHLTSGDADLSILAGDLNTEPGDLAYRLLLAVPGLFDAFVEAGEDAQDIAATNESLTNSFTPQILVKNNVPGKRIDYVMYHSAAGVQVKLKSYQLPLPNKVPECAFSYSDHEAVAVSLIVDKAEEPRRRNSSELTEALIEEGLATCKEALDSLANGRLFYWFASLVLFVLLTATLVITTAPKDYQIVYHILKVIITLSMCFTLIMATAWNAMEKHAILAGKLSMTICLKKLKTKEVQ